jgi:predicted AAA+ superfamily ATPase
MKRTLAPYIIKDLPDKIVMISGPRQCGKTTLSKQLYSDFDYFNYDAVADRLALKAMSWDRAKDLIIFDELHKMKNWKQWLKGVYDKEGIPPSLLVTGSSKLNTYRKMGDSLAGRYFQFRLHPLDMKEVVAELQQDPNVAFKTLFTLGGFPEPFLKADETYYKRWRRTHLDIILRQDLIGEYAVKDIQAIETLVHLLQERVGSAVSYSALARDLERDPKTIKRWLTMLENLYVIFKVTPYHKNIARSLLKEPKYYFYDNGRVENDKGARLENLVACALQKELDFITDTTGAHTQLHFLRTKDGKEIDFLIVIDKKPVLAIEVKWADEDLSPAFKYFSEYLPDCAGIQLVKNLSREKTYPNGFAIRDVIKWLANINLTNGYT